MGQEEEKGARKLICEGGKGREKLLGEAKRADITREDANRAEANLDAARERERERVTVGVEM